VSGRFTDLPDEAIGPIPVRGGNGFQFTDGSGEGLLG
jgi:hypothetical protein